MTQAHDLAEKLATLARLRAENRAAMRAVATAPFDVTPEAMDVLDARWKAASDALEAAAKAFKR